MTEISKKMPVIKNVCNGILATISNIFFASYNYRQHVLITLNKDKKKKIIIIIESYLFIFDDPSRIKTLLNL